jgi:pyrimidine-nucleoside phosphorylase
MPNQIQSLVDSISLYDQNSLNRVIEAFASEPVEDSDIASLTLRLAQPTYSGRNDHERRADFASTGGPSSLATMIGPLVMRGLNYEILKITVPGRPAGSIDVFAQSPGYRFVLDDHEIEEGLAECGFVQVLAGSPLAKVDAEVFARRQSIGKQAVPVLAIASILAKKLSAGTNVTGVEIRTSPFGNFGSTFSITRRNAESLCRVASILGIQATAYVVDGEQPLQPFVGRGEALLAIVEWLNGSADGRMQSHISNCCRMAAMTVGAEPEYDLGIGCVRSCLNEHLKSQGSSYEAAERYALSIRNQHVHSIQAAFDGYVSYNLGQIRGAITSAQSIVSNEWFPDPAGIIIEKMPRTWATQSETLLTFRCAAHSAPKFREEIQRSITLADEPLLPEQKIEVIHA